jgi:hypothetical protein
MRKNENGKEIKYCWSTINIFYPAFDNMGCIHPLGSSVISGIIISSIEIPPCWKVLV